LFAGAAEITDPTAPADPMCERDTAAEIDPDGDALAVLVGVLDELVEAGQIIADRRVGCVDCSSRPRNAARWHRT
jgi:hypothetical protein